MLRASFAVLLCCVAAIASAAQAETQETSANAALVDRKAGRPMVLAFDVEPSYYQYVLLPVDLGEGEDEKTFRVSIEPPAEPDWMEGHWSPSVSLCLRADATSKQGYCATLNVDRTQSLRTFGTARLMSASGEQMFRKLTSTMFAPHAKVELRVVRKGEHVTTSFNGVTIDEGDIGFTPMFWMLSGSSGIATIEAIEEVEAPLGPGEWPTTIEAAVALELEDMTSTSKATLRALRKDELTNFRVGWGTGIIDSYGLSRGNRALLEAACGKECEPAAAAMVIMQAVWTALQSPPDANGQR